MEDLTQQNVHKEADLSSRIYNAASEAYALNFRQQNLFYFLDQLDGWWVRFWKGFHSPVVLSIIWFIWLIWLDTLKVFQKLIKYKWRGHLNMCIYLNACYMETHRESTAYLIFN